jgi:hypothetical protein
MNYGNRNMKSYRDDPLSQIIELSRSRAHNLNHTLQNIRFNNPLLVKTSQSISPGSTASFYSEL